MGEREKINKAWNSNKPNKERSSWVKAEEKKGREIMKVVRCTKNERKLEPNKEHSNLVKAEEKKAREIMEAVRCLKEHKKIEQVREKK